MTQAAPQGRAVHRKIVTQYFADVLTLDQFECLERVATSIIGRLEKDNSQLGRHHARTEQEA
jgi:hypothetical protein